MKNYLKYVFTCVYRIYTGWFKSLLDMLSACFNKNSTKSLVNLKITNLSWL